MVRGKNDNLFYRNCYKTMTYMRKCFTRSLSATPSENEVTPS